MFKAQEFDDPQIYRRVEAQATFVGTNGVVKLYAETAVYLHFTLVVNPWDAEHECPVRYDNAIIDFGFYKLGVACNRCLQGSKDLLDCLMEFWLSSTLAITSWMSDMCLVSFSDGFKRIERFDLPRVSCYPAPNLRI